jgi:hypothetical protein
MIVPFFSNNHDSFAKINGKTIKQYQKNEQKDYINKDKKLVIRRKMFKSFTIKRCPQIKLHKHNKQNLKHAKIKINDEK